MCFILCSCGLVGSARAAGENLLTNPGFEDGTGGWSATSPSVYAIDSKISVSGVQCIRGDETDTTSLGRFYQDVTAYAVPGREYVIRGWIRTQDIGQGGAVFGLDYVNADGWTPEGGYVMESPWISGTTDWIYYTSTPFALPPMPADATALWFLCDFNNGAGTAWFDEMELVEVSAGVAPVADFGANPIEGTAPLTVQFADQSGGTPSGWEWDFGDGDGTNATEQHPVHTFLTPGTYDITLRVTNAAGSDTAERVSFITVTDPNNPPLLDPIGPKSALAGAEIAFMVSGSDPDAGAALVFGVQDMPEGAEFDTADRWFSWTPSPDQYGVFTVNFTLTDGQGAMDYELVAINVARGTSFNNPPVLSPIGNRSATEGMPFSLTLIGSDPEYDALFYSADPLPANATIAGDVFLWTPPDGEAGTYEITFSVSDGELTDAENVTITVVSPSVENSPPVFAPIGNRSADVGSLCTLTVSAEDPEGDVLTYRALNLPENATFDTTTGVFAWTPVAGEEGTYAITFTVADAEQEDEETIVITVGEALSVAPPVVSFSSTPVSGYAPLPVEFTDLSTGEPTAWNWSFGDGVTSQEQNPSHTYLAAGTYDVTLAVSNRAGTNTSRVSGAVVVQQSPSPSGGGSSGGGGGNVMTESSASDQPSGAQPAGAPSAPEAEPESPVHPEEAAATESILQATHSIGIREEGVGERQVVIDRDAAVSEGYTVTRGEHTIVLARDRVAIIITAEGIVEEGGQIRGTLTGVQITSTPVAATIGIGRVRAWFTVLLPSLHPDASVTVSIIEKPSAAAQEGFAASAANADMAIDAVAFTMRVDEVNLGPTGRAAITMTVPPQWVQDHGGIGRIRILRVPDDGTPSVLTTAFSGNDTDGNMIFTGDSPDGLSIFGLVSVKVTAAAHEPEATPTAVPWTRLSIAGGLITWMTRNSITIAGLVVIIVILVAAGYRQRRTREKVLAGPGYAPGASPPPDGCIDDLIEGGKGKAYASIIDVLNAIDAQVQDLDRALAQGQMNGTAEASGVVDRFFYTCQVAEERIKGAALQGHLTDGQVQDLHDQLSAVVKKMVQVAARSPQVTQLLQQRYEGTV